MFSNKDWKHDALKVLIDTTGTTDRRPDSGRPSTVRITAIIHQVEDLSLLSQESRRLTELCAVCLRHLKQSFYSIYFIFSYSLKQNCIIYRK